MLSVKKKERKVFQGLTSSKKNEQTKRDFDSPFKANSLLAQVKWLFVFFCKVKGKVESPRVLVNSFLTENHINFSLKEMIFCFSHDLIF